jgi:hypothetical protein
VIALSHERTADRGRWLTGGLALLLVVATLDEGGGAPTGLLVWHALLALMLALRLLLPGEVAAPAAGNESRARLPVGASVGWALFLLLALSGAARAPYAYGAILVLLELGAWTVALYLASRAGGSLLGRLIAPLAIAATLQSLLALYQALATDRRPPGSFLQPNHLALWLVAVLLLLVGQTVDRGRRGRILAAVCGPALVAGIVVTGSRGAALGLVGGGIWLVAASWRRRSPGQRRALIAGGAVLLLLLGAGLAWRMRGHDPYRYQRVRIWSASVTGFLGQPWWGTGPGQFEAAAANQRFPDQDGPLRYDRAHKATHSDWLRLPAEFGGPAALVLLVTALLAVGRIRQRRRLGRLPPGADGAAAALVAILVHAGVDNPSRWSAVTLLGAVLLGALLAERWAADERPATTPGLLPRLALAAGLLLLFLVADLAPYLAWRAARGLPRGRLEAHQLAQLERAQARNRIHPDYPMRLAEHLAAGAPEIARYAAAREAAERALRLQPADARYRLAAARIEARACRALFRTEACRQRVASHYLRAERLSRYDPSIPLNRAIFLLDLGDPVGARRAAERALSLEPESVLPRMVLAEALVDSAAPDAFSRAGELLREAEEKARRWADASREPTQQPLLHLDPAQLERLRRKLEALAPAASTAELAR